MKAPPPTKTLTEADTEVETAQAEFLRDMQASLEEMKDGKVLPAEEALQLIELGLDDDELESRLPQ